MCVISDLRGALRSLTSDAQNPTGAPSVTGMPCSFMPVGKETLLIRFYSQFLATKEKDVR